MWAFWFVDGRNEVPELSLPDRQKVDYTADNVILDELTKEEIIEKGNLLFTLRRPMPHRRSAVFHTGDCHGGIKSRGTCMADLTFGQFEPTEHGGSFPPRTFLNDISGLSMQNIRPSTVCPYFRHPPAEENHIKYKRQKSVIR